MIILALRTDQNVSSMFLYDKNKMIDHYEWLSQHRLTLELNQKIKNFLNKNQKKLTDLDGLIVYRGPGSFTGLRIGVSLMNAISYGFNIPIVGTSSINNDSWILEGINRLFDQDNDKIVYPIYDQPIKITQPKK